MAALETHYTLTLPSFERPVRLLVVVAPYYKDIADTAQSKLEQLQQKLMERNSMSGNDGLHTSKSFYDFMDAERNRETADRQTEIARSNQRGRVESPPAPARRCYGTSGCQVSGRGRPGAAREWRPRH